MQERNLENLKIFVNNYIEADINITHDYEFYSLDELYDFYNINY